MSAAIAIGGRRLQLVIGDITVEDVDAIANAANAALRGGGGVDGAIHEAAGPELMAELRSRYPDGTPTGSAVATGGHRLPARWVLHAVGPVWRGGDSQEEELLRNAYRSCLALADELGARSLAFPAISLGIYGYPIEEGARVALDVVAGHLAGADTGLDVVRFVLREATYPAFAERLREMEALAD